jgi:hypothetical protein
MVIKRSCLKSPWSSHYEGKISRAVLRISLIIFSLQIQSFICIRGYTLYACHERGKVNRAPGQKAVGNGAPSCFATPGDLILNYTPAILGSKIGPGGNIRVGVVDGSDLRDSARLASPQKGHWLRGVIRPWQYKHFSLTSFSSNMTPTPFSHLIFSMGIPP